MLVLLAGCNSSPASTTPTGSSGIPAPTLAPTSATATASPTIQSVSPSVPSPSASATFVALVGPPCRAADLAGRVGLQSGAGGNGVTFLILTDRGRDRCVLRGTPIVAFLDEHGREVSLAVRYEPSGYFPAIPNDGVGLLPFADGSSGVVVGIRGEAVLPLQYSDLDCSTPVAAIRVSMDEGTVTIPATLPLGNTPGCLKPAIIVNPFQPAGA